MGNTIGRPPKPVSARSKNAGISFYPTEIAAFRVVTRKLRLKSIADYFRRLAIAENHPDTRGKIVLPRNVDFPLRTP